MDRTFEDIGQLDGKRIIVVEDDALLALDVADQLQSFGATVLGPAPTAYYARQLIGPERRRLDGAVLDIHLHGQDVYELADILCSAMSRSCSRQPLTARAFRNASNTHRY
jgi:CheY-like chemotaxis protein